MHTKNEQKGLKSSFFLKKIAKTLANSKIMPTFASLSTANLIGRLAQLVQSICLTSRGSAVRIRQRPPKKTSSLQAIADFFCVHTSILSTAQCCSVAKRDLFTNGYKAAHMAMSSVRGDGD